MRSLRVGMVERGWMGMDCVVELSWVGWMLSVLWEVVWKWIY